jgi:hypothetical protein
MDARSVDTAREGFIAGLILYGIVALFFVVANLAVGYPPFQTAALLGTPLLRDPGADPTGAILAFNGIHLAGSILLGFAAAILTAAVERLRRAWYVFFFVFIAGSILAIVALGVLAAEMSHVLPWSWVALAHLLGAGAVATYLGWAHRPR